MKKKDKKSYVLEVINILNKRYGSAKCDLSFSNPFELLVATILSAQCTDKRVNKITSVLFKTYKNIEEYAKADFVEFEQHINSTVFYKNKAKNIIRSARSIIEQYNGNVPQIMESLLKLPGVARKTANVVLSYAFEKTEGIIVDTHVIRISKLLKLTEHNNPIKIEEDLMKIIPQKYWIKFSFLIQILGKKICKAKNQNHFDCPINSVCLLYCNK
ncbi:MAG: endonuclease III [Endomicrobium sp.]|jgi:endonuclease-3|nr:endonuclease III [Endomicrobium sp.]